MEGQLVVVAGVIGIGILHGVLPDHGWPIAAMYAIRQRNRWIAGTAAGLILGIGHLFSSIVLVAAFFALNAYVDITETPVLGLAAGTVLILLGIREYRHGGHHHHGGGADHEEGDHVGEDHEHAHSDHEYDHDDHSRDHAEHSHEHHAHSEDDAGQSDHGHSHGHGILPDAVGRYLPDGGFTEANRDSLYSIGMVALVLGFAHEEPIQIIAICVNVGGFCLELMIIYSLAVIVAILVPTLLLIAGYEHHRTKVERLTPHLSWITAAVLILMGSYFVAGELLPMVGIGVPGIY